MLPANEVRRFYQNRNRLSIDFARRGRGKWRLKKTRMLESTRVLRSRVGLCSVLGVPSKFNLRRPVVRYGGVVGRRLITGPENFGGANIATASSVS